MPGPQGVRRGVGGRAKWEPNTRRNRHNPAHGPLAPALLSGMPYTVRLCRDLSGWFATLCDDLLGYPGATVQWQMAVESPEQAMSVLDVAQTLAQRLVGEAFVSWVPEPGPAPTRATWLRASASRSPVVGGGSWVRCHYDAGRTLVVAHVSRDHIGHCVRLEDSRHPEEAAIYYPTRAAAFDVAEGLVRIRYRNHDCSSACSGWTENASAEEPRPQP